MDFLRRELEKYRGPRQSILLRDGRRIVLPSPLGTAQGEVHSYMLDCVAPDMERRPRPEPPRWFYAMADAANREEAIRLFYTDYEPGDDSRHIGDAFCLDCLAREGRLVDSSIAPSDAQTDVRPIPYGETEPIPWEDPHALYKELV